MATRKEPAAVSSDAAVLDSPMTPESLRSLAALLESDPSLELVGSLRVVTRKARSANAERQARFKARRRGVTEGVSEALPGNARDFVSPTPPSVTQGDSPESDQVAKSSELQKNPENQKELTGTARARARGAKGVTSGALLRSVTTRVTRSRWCPPDWSPRPEDSARAPRGVNVAAELAKMREFEFSRAYSDWDAVWRRWLARAGEFPTRNGRAPEETPLDRVARLKREA